MAKIVYEDENFRVVFKHEQYSTKQYTFEYADGKDALDKPRWTILNSTDFRDKRIPNLLEALAAKIDGEVS